MDERISLLAKNAAAVSSIIHQLFVIIKLAVCYQWTVWLKSLGSQGLEVLQ